MRKPLFRRLTAAALALMLLTAPAAQALTVDQAAQLIQDLYVDEVPASVLEQPTVEEMVAALGDPYTEYFTPEAYEKFTASMSDSTLVGIGIVFTLEEDGLHISEVLEDSPAQKGGLKAGDIIVAVDGQSVLGQDTATVTGWIQGEVDTKVKVTYLRGKARKSVTLTRALVVLAATTYELIDDHIGYISCTTFGNETAQHFRDAIAACNDKVNAWVVDLRSNLGGITEAATESAGYFTGPGRMAYLRDGEDQYGAYVHESESLTIYPVIVLVDQYSASSSEIFAAAIQSTGAGIVIGTRTYGKGVAQTVLDRDYFPEYFAEGDAIKITSHRFFSPAGNTTDQVGVIPDLLVDEEYMGDVAYLLCGSSTAHNQETMRLDMTWRWYIDLTLATKPENMDAFQVLLDAIPENKRVWLGGGDFEVWSRSSVEDIAEQYGLTFNEPRFADHDDSEYPTPLSVLKTYGLVRGREDGSFYPQDSLTRAELCQLLAVALNCIAPTNSSPYTDVSDDAWYAPAVIAMTNMGLVNGMGNGIFSPDAPVDHQQLITIMGRLAQRLNMNLYDAVQEREAAEFDVVGLAEYANWAKASAWLLSYSQKGYFGNTITLLWDSAENIDPLANTSRDEAAYALYCLLSYIDILPA